MRTGRPAGHVVGTEGGLMNDNLELSPTSANPGSSSECESEGWCCSEQPKLRKGIRGQKDAAIRARA
jgi:hypothetical protein